MDTISIGGTPLLKLERMALPNGNRVFAKCELYNRVSGSHYDRVYHHLITKMQEEGKIDPKSHVLLENSSGTAAIAFARMSRLFGFDATVVLPRTISQKKIQLCWEAGAEVLFPKEGKENLYVAGTLDTVLRLKGQNRSDGKEYFYLNHSWNKRTLASMRPMAEEIISQLPEGERVDVFVPALGNGTSSIGPAIPLKQVFPDMQLIGFESFNAPVFYTLKYPGRFEKVYNEKPEFKLHGLSGTSAFGIEFPFLIHNLELVDDIYLIKENEWKPMQKKIRETEGLGVGPTSAAGLLVVEKLASQVREKSFLVIFYDSAERYNGSSTSCAEKAP